MKLTAGPVVLFVVAMDIATGQQIDIARLPSTTCEASHTGCENVLDGSDASGWETVGVVPVGKHITISFDKLYDIHKVSLMQPYWGSEKQFHQMQLTFLTPTGNKTLEIQSSVTTDQKLVFEPFTILGISAVQMTLKVQSGRFFGSDNRGNGLRMIEIMAVADAMAGCAKAFDQNIGTDWYHTSQSETKWWIDIKLQQSSTMCLMRQIRDKHLRAKRLRFTKRPQDKYINVPALPWVWLNVTFIDGSRLQILSTVSSNNALTFTAGITELQCYIQRNIPPPPTTTAATTTTTKSTTTTSTTTTTAPAPTPSPATPAPATPAPPSPKPPTPSPVPQSTMTSQPEVTSQGPPGGLKIRGSKSTPGDGGGSPAAAIAGGVIAGVLIIAIIIAVFILVRVSRRRRGMLMDKEAPPGAKVNDAAEDTDEDGDDYNPLPDVVTPTAEDEIPSQPPEGEDDSESRQFLVKEAELGDFIRKNKQNNCQGFLDSYKNIPAGFVHKHEVAKKTKPEYNRFKNVLPYDHSRVILHGAKTDYINANYMDGYRKERCYIATQGPLRQTTAHFWTMVWSENITKVVMVTNVVEGGRAGAANHTLRVTQFHFTSWPDRGVPVSSTALIAFRGLVRKESNTGAATVVHCSAGIGRSGTYIALDELLEQMETEHEVNVYACVRRLRKARVNMVQTLEQYIFIHDSLLEVSRCGQSSIACESYDAVLPTLKQVGADRTSPLTRQLEVILTCEREFADATYQDGEKNSKRNRTPHILPSSVNRPFISSKHTDYINAVFVHGYKKKGAYIVTQMPLPETQTEFWALVSQFQVKTIVMLNKENQRSDDPIYWPEKDKASYGTVDVTLTSTDDKKKSFTRREFEVQQKTGSFVKNVIKLTVAHFQLHDFVCPAAEGQEEAVYANTEATKEPLYANNNDLKDELDDVANVNQDALIAVREEIKKWQRDSQSTDNPVLVHCLYGGAPSGIFCCHQTVCDKADVERQIDVYNAVKTARQSRPQLVPSLKQYALLHDLAKKYLQSFQIYDNFK